MDILLYPVPVWIFLSVVAIALLVIAFSFWRIQQRLDRHAESIAHMDDWADEVDEFMKRHERIYRQKFVRYAVDPQILRNSTPVRH